jgi:hypothetical protein
MARSPASRWIRRFAEKAGRSRGGREEFDRSKYVDDLIEQDHRAIRFCSGPLATHDVFAPEPISELDRQRSMSL